MGSVMAPIRPQIAVLVALVALIPTGIMVASGRVTPLAALTRLNVLIIAASLYYMFGPAESETFEPSA